MEAGGRATRQAEVCKVEGRVCGPPRKYKGHTRFSTLMACNWTILLSAKAFVSMASLLEASILALTITKDLTRKKKHF